MDTICNTQANAAGMVELTRAALDAPLETRIALAWLLNKNLEAFGLHKQADKMLGTMNELAGFNIAYRSRRAEYVRARCVYAFVAHNLGMNNSEVARQLGVTYTNVTYYCDIMEKAFTSPFFPDYVELYNNFIKKLNDYGKERN